MAAADHHGPPAQNYAPPPQTGYAAPAPLQQTRIGSREVTKTRTLQELFPKVVQQGTRQVEQHVPVITYKAIPQYTTKRVPKVSYEIKAVTRIVKVPRVTYKEQTKQNSVNVPRVTFETVKSKVQEQVPKVAFTTVQQQQTEFIPSIDNDYVTVRDVKHEPQVTYAEEEHGVTRDSIVYNPVTKTLTTRGQHVWPEISTTNY